MLFRQLVLFIAIITLSSCSTILNKKTYPVYVTSNEQHAAVKIKDSIYKLPARVQVKRSKEDLEVTLLTDSLSRNYNIQAILDPKFTHLNLTGSVIAPINYAVDLTTPKRFYYGKYILLNSAETDSIIQPKSTRLARYFSYKPETHKGDINTYLSVPFLNFFQFNFPNSSTVKEDTGMFLFGTGIEYYHKDKEFLNIGIGSYANVYESAVEDKALMFSHFIRITNNHKVNRFTLGYGLGFSHNIVTQKYYLYSQFEDEVIRIRRTQNTIDLVLAAQMQVVKNIHIGLTYKPSVYRLSSPSDFAYNHVISAEITAKLRLKKKK
ncbi:MAG: hypothetical protein LBI72_12950 [Flavobacteriaceae bacterium]|jgi:hypothetical protein|nr:hypothetical protein [Flavobacteriaceae bacterium]